MAADYKRFLNHVQLVDDKELYLTPIELPRTGPVTVAVTAHTLDLVGSCDRICDQKAASGASG